MTSFFEHQRSSFKRNYLRNLISLASSDGHLDEREKALLYDIGKKRGLKDWQINELLTDTSYHEIFLPESVANRMNLLFDLMQLIYADGHVCDREMAFIQQIIQAFNFSKYMSAGLIELFKEGTPATEDWSRFTDSLYVNA